MFARAAPPLILQQSQQPRGGADISVQTFLQTGQNIGIGNIFWEYRISILLLPKVIYISVFRETLQQERQGTWVHFDKSKTKIILGAIIKRCRYISADIPSNRAKHRDWKYLQEIQDIDTAFAKGNLYIIVLRETLQQGHQGTWVRFDTLKKHKLSLKKGDCLFGRVSSEAILDKRDKAPTKFLIRAAPAPTPSFRGFFCLRKLHKFNNSIVRNYFPPHYEPFVKGLNFHLLPAAFEQSSTVWLSLL